MARVAGGIGSDGSDELLQIVCRADVGEWGEGLFEPAGKIDADATFALEVLEGDEMPAPQDDVDFLLGLKAEAVPVACEK